MKHPPQKRVLVVDDDRLMRDLVAAYLRNEPCQVKFAKSAEEAIEELKKSEFDMVISDRDMPGGMPGTAFAEKVKAIAPQTPFILMSGSTNETDLDLAYVEVFLPKPFTRQELVASMQTASKALTQ